MWPEQPKMSERVCMKVIAASPYSNWNLAPNSNACYLPCWCCESFLFPPNTFYIRRLRCFTWHGFRIHLRVASCEIEAIQKLSSICILQEFWLACYEARRPDVLYSPSWSWDYLCSMRDYDCWNYTTNCLDVTEFPLDLTKFNSFVHHH